MQADMATARSLLEQSRELAHRVGDELALVRTTLGFGVAAFNQNDLPNAMTLLQEAHARHQVLDDPTGVWLALLYLAVTAAGLGDTDRAITFSEECLALCDTRNAYPSRIYALSGLALGRWLSGDRQEAGTLIREGLPAAQQSDDQWVLAHYLEMLGWIVGTDGQQPAPPGCSARRTRSGAPPECHCPARVTSPPPTTTANTSHATHWGTSSSPQPSSTAPDSPPSRPSTTPLRPPANHRPRSSPYSRSTTSRPPDLQTTPGRRTLCCLSSC